MIRILGTKAVLYLVLLLLLNGGAAYALYEYVIPMREAKERQLKSLKAEIDARRAEVATFKEEYVLLQSQLRIFKELEKKGFFNNQNRARAKESIAELMGLSGTLKYKLRIMKGELIEDVGATAANHVVIKSPVAIDIDSLDDVDVYTFTMALQNKFPGNVDITGMKLERKELITAALLRQIGGGGAVPLVKSTVEFDWRTMVKNDKLSEFESDEEEIKPDNTTSMLGGVPQPVSTNPVTQPGSVVVQ